MKAPLWLRSIREQNSIRSHSGRNAAKLGVEDLERRDVPSGLANTPWPMYGMNAQHTGDSPYSGPQNGSVAYMVEGSIIGPNGLISSRTSSNFDGSLQSMNPSGGWFPAVSADGTIYTPSDEGLLFAVNPNQGGASVNDDLELVGGVKWATMLGRSQFAPAIGADGTIYVSALDSFLYAVNPNGTVKWKFKAGQEFESAPALSADGLVVYAGSDDNCLYAVNTSTGTLKWKYKASDDVNSPPAIDAAGNIYITTSNWNAWSIKPTGKLNWKVPISNSHGSTWSWADGGPAIDQSAQTVYFGGADGLYAYSFSGAFKWKHVSARVWTHPAVGADGMIYYTATNNMLYALQSNGSVQWSSPVVAAADPILNDDGTLYCGWQAFTDGGVARPTVRWLQDSPDPVAPGGDLLLRARDLLDNGTITSVDYYRDANGSNQLEVGTDEFVGTNDDGSNYWGIIVTAPATPGTYTYFAQATDNDGRLSNVVSKLNTVGSPLLAAGGESSEAAPTPAVTTREVKPLLKEAILQWRKAGAGTNDLAGLQVKIMDLPDGVLGLASGHTITLDDNAAGWGWFVDRTPRNDSEFRRAGNQGEAGRMDLLSVLTHELGHILGHEHAEGGVMAESLAPGIRTVGVSAMNHLWGFLPPVANEDHLPSPTIARAGISRFTS